RTATAIGVGKTPSSGATSQTTAAAELVVGAVGIENIVATTVTPGSGFTNLALPSTGSGKTALALQAEYRVASAVGTFSATATSSVTLPWAAGVVTYKETCGNGVVDPREQCDGGGCCTSTCKLASSGTVCRAAAGVCDKAEVCTGTSAVCPADVKQTAGTVCRAAAGPCDVAETCDGTTNACPADKLAPATTVCRVAAGECDVAESCTGTSAACPADAKKASGTACTDDGNACTADRCDGTNVACQHPAGNAGAVCR